MSAMDSDKKSYQNSDGSHGAATPELAKTGPSDPTDAPLLVKPTQAGIWKVEAAANVGVTLAYAPKSLTHSSARSGGPSARHCYGLGLPSQGEGRIVCSEK